VVGGGLGEATEDGDASAAENFLDDGFLEAGGVVVEVEKIGIFVEAEFLDAVGIGELAESAVLVGGEGVLEFVGDGHVGHAGIIAGRVGERWRGWSGVWLGAEGLKKFKDL
jgi:hypothetical protein